LRDAGLSPLGSDLAQSLENLQSRLAAEASVEALSETEQLVSRKLADWGGEAGEYFKKKTADVKEVLRLVARTAEAWGSAMPDTRVSLANFRRS